MSSKPVPIVPAMATDISRNLAEPDLKRDIAQGPEVRATRGVQ